MRGLLTSFVARVKRRYQLFEEERKHSLKRRKSYGVSLHKQDSLLQSVEELAMAVDHLNSCCVAKDGEEAGRDMEGSLWNPFVIETRIHRIAFQARIATHLLQQQQEELKDQEKHLQKEPAVLTFQRTQLAQASERLSRLALAIQGLKNMLSTSLESDDEPAAKKMRCLYTC